MKKKNDRFLHLTLTGASLVSMFCSLFFLSGSITGNVAGNMTKQGSGILGGILFIAGLAGLFVFTRERF